MGSVLWVYVELTTLHGTTRPISRGCANGKSHKRQQDRGRVSAARTEVPRSRAHGLSGNGTGRPAGQGAKMGIFSRSPSETRRRAGSRGYDEGLGLAALAPYLGASRPAGANDFKPCFDGDGGPPDVQTRFFANIIQPSRWWATYAGGQSHRKPPHLSFE